MSSSTIHTERFHSRLITYCLLLAFLLLLVPLSEASHPLKALPSISAAGEGERAVLDAGGAAPPPGQKPITPYLYRLFGGSPDGLNQQLSIMPAGNGESVLLLLRQLRLAPVKFTSTYVDMPPSALLLYKKEGNSI